ncbi:MAG: hypothetical protein V3V31_08295 [Methylococcales bacterium]
MEKKIHFPDLMSGRNNLEGAIGYGGDVADKDLIMEAAVGIEPA